MRLHPVDHSNFKTHCDLKTTIRPVLERRLSEETYLRGQREVQLVWPQESLHDRKPPKPGDVEAQRQAKGTPQGHTPLWLLPNVHGIRGGA
jgi:hypothetical protein